MEERLAKACLVIAKLGLRDGEVLPDTVAFGAVSVGQAFEGVQDGTRSLVPPRQRGLTGDRTFQVDVGRELRMEYEAKFQSPLVAERNTGRLTDVLGQGVQLAAENLGYVFAWVRPPADGDGIAGMTGGRGVVRREVGQTLGQIGNGSWQVTHAPAGDVLLIQVVLLQRGHSGPPNADRGFYRFFKYLMVA